MNIRTISTRIIVPLLCGLAMLFSAAPVRAQITTNNFYYRGNQGSSPGTNWAGPGITAYWTNVFNGPTSQPTNGTATATTTNYNFYILTNNGTLLGNGTASTLIRDPFTSPFPSPATFLGDSLILLTNTQIRFKSGKSSGINLVGNGVNTPYNVPTNIFQGNHGVPGIVLSGGCINAGDTGYAYVIQGTMFATPGTLSYLNPADTFNNDPANRVLVIASQLSGSGGIALLNGTDAASGTANTATTPTPITATNNNFTGTWIVKAGWLQGNGDGNTTTNTGYNSLGTNTSVVYDIDPGWGPNLAQFATGTAAPFFDVGPAVLDFGSSLVNSGGSVILSNGGCLYMHGTIFLRSLNLEGTLLSPGLYSYSQLVGMATANNNFSPAGFPTGSGYLIIQPYGPPNLPPIITVQPYNEILYSSRTAVFSVAAVGNPTPTYQWQKNGVVLTNGGNISGANTAFLSVSGVASKDVATYSVIASNANGTTASIAVTLSVVGTSYPYEAAAESFNPVCFYQFDDLYSPETGTAPALDYAGGFNGLYGINVLNGDYGIFGPEPSLGFPGFSNPQYAAQFATSPGNNINCPPWNFSGPSTTFTAWLNPASAYQNINAGVIVCRDTTPVTGTVAGLVYYGSANANGVPIGYVWDNEPETYGWNSGIVPPANQWSMVTLVVTPTNATIYMFNANGLVSSTHTYPHVLQSFNTNEYIGEDAAEENANGTRSFLGDIADVAVFNTALTGDQLAGLFYVATGVSNYPPSIALEPLSQTVYTGQTVQLYVGADGSEPLTYQWAAGVTGSGGPYNNLTDGNGISGSHSPTLTIQNVNLNQALDYVVTVANTTVGSPVVSTPAATLTVIQAGAAISNITMSVQEAIGQDWNTLGEWNDNQGGLAASQSALEFPGSIYEVLPGAHVRTPANFTDPVFPGNVLLVDGAGTFINSPAVGSAQGELLTKQITPASGYGSVTFPLLVMNGGQVDASNGGAVGINGTINIASNSFFYVGTGGGEGRTFIINAQLTGSATLQYQDFDTKLTGGMYLTCPSNTFTGRWNDVIGPLVGLGANSLGTNTITVGAAGVLQTAYNINNSNADLFLSGQMYLTQTDTFFSVALGTVGLPAGTYTAAQLTSNYPAYFPSNWPALTYASQTQTNATGAIIVLNNLAPTIIQQPTPTLVTQLPQDNYGVTIAGNTVSLYPSQPILFAALGAGTPPLSYQWLLNGVPVANSTNGVTGAIITGAQTTNLTLLNISTNGNAAGNYTFVVSNSAGVVTSAPAVLTLNSYSPAEIIPLTLFEPSGDDWNTATVWNDGAGGLPAVQSSVEFPGSIYEVVPGTMMRTAAANIPYTNFPGELIVQGTGVFIDLEANTAGTAQGEIRFKQGATGEINYFPLLVMAGGQLDNGNGGSLAEIAGNMEVISNTPIYADDTGSTPNRPYQIDAYLFGNGSIQYIDSDATLSGGLNITCPTNNFTGTWNVQQGALLGSGSNCLGTNSITIGATGVLETLYPLNNPKANLLMIAGGRMYLTQTDTFFNVVLGNSALAQGTYTAAQLCSNYPAYFPSNWNSLPFAAAASQTTATGSITVLASGVFILQNPTPTNITAYPPQSITFSAIAGGNPPLFYQWQFNGVNLANSANINGAQTPTLNILNVASNEGGNYTIVVSNSLGSVTSAPAVMTIGQTFPATNITLTLVETGSQDWNTVGAWNDGQGGLPASLSALQLPGSTYEVLPSTLLRTPSGPGSFTNFPGQQLTVDGNGVWVDLGGGAQGEIRFKQGISGETNYFPLLIMAGGQLDNGNAGSLAEIAGSMEVISNTPIYADDSGSTATRPWQIDAYLFGNGSIQYIDSDATLSGGLNITCPTNKFTGTWLVQQGAVLGSGANSLGTNSITVGVADVGGGVLETLYNINSPYATLTLNGQMYLHNNDTFQAVVINGTSLTPGSYTFAQLTNAYPTTFPATWNAIMTSTFTTGSGSITVLGAALPPESITYTYSAHTLTLTWSLGSLLQATNLLGPWTTNVSATSPYVVPTTNAEQFFKILVP